MLQDLMHNTYKVLINTLQSHTTYLSSDFNVDVDADADGVANLSEKRFCSAQVYIKFDFYINLIDTQQYRYST